MGSDAERYLRVLQLADKAPLHPWTVRGFAPRALVGVLPESAEHPWASRIDFTLESHRRPGVGMDPAESRDSYQTLLTLSEKTTGESG